MRSIHTEIHTHTQTDTYIHTVIPRQRERESGAPWKRGHDTEGKKRSKRESDTFRLQISPARRDRDLNNPLATQRERERDTPVCTPTFPEQTKEITR